MPAPFPASTPTANPAETATKTPVAPAVAAATPAALAPAVAKARKRITPVQPKMVAEPAAPHPHIRIFSRATMAVVAGCVAVAGSVLYFSDLRAGLLQSSLLQTGSGAPASVETALLFAIAASLSSIIALGLTFKWLHFHLGHSVASGGWLTSHASRQAHKNSWHPYEVVESLTFLWVFCALIFALYNIHLLFGGTSGVLELLVSTGDKSQLAHADLQLLLQLSFYCGLLGGTLANLRFFLISKYDKNVFNIDYVYRYVASPLVSVAAGFMAFLLLVAWPYQTAAGTVELQPASFAFLFCLAGFFSDSFFLILRKIASAIESFVAAPGELERLQRSQAATPPPATTPAAEK